MAEKEIKRKIKVLKKLKRGLRVGSPARRELNRKLRELKQQLANLYQSSPEKQALIEEIYKLEPQHLRLRTNLNKFTVAQLQFHLDRVKKGKNRRI